MLFLSTAVLIRRRYILESTLIAEQIRSNCGNKLMDHLVRIPLPPASLSTREASSWVIRIVLQRNSQGDEIIVAVPDFLVLVTSCIFTRRLSLNCSTRDAKQFRKLFEVKENLPGRESSLMPSQDDQEKGVPIVLQSVSGKHFNSLHPKLDMIFSIFVIIDFVGNIKNLVVLDYKET
ncbi:uncharacterized protein LOC112167279 isoform X4 [Rosa chinensis]|uniref:uncharacterized protein LOC112167279 isoform X4 n=1 Tax=Rosa chinensis TaxID=74649 RepID=UPI001AD8B2AC|nr:uncharacterized protein LOC112167279 isoform X4 [Rosa chinensis]